MSDRQISEGGEEKAASVSQEAKSTPEKERINESKVNTPKSTSSRPVSSRSTATKKKKKSLTIAAGDGEEDPQPEMSDDEIIGRYVEGVRDAHKELRRSLLFQQKLIEKCRSLKSELVEKSTKLQWAYRMKMEDDAMIAELKDSLRAAHKETDEVREKESAAQELVKQLMKEVDAMRSQVSKFQKSMVDMDDRLALEAPKSRSPHREEPLDPGETPFMRWKRRNDIWFQDDEESLRSTVSAKSLPANHQRGQGGSEGEGRAISPQPRDAATAGILHDRLLSQSSTSRPGLSALALGLDSNDRPRLTFRASTATAADSSFESIPRISRLLSSPVHDDFSAAVEPQLARDPTMSRLMEKYGADRDATRKGVVGQVPLSLEGSRNRLAAEAGEGLRVGGLGVGFGFAWKEGSSLSSADPRFRSGHVISSSQPQSRGKGKRIERKPTLGERRSVARFPAISVN